MLERWCDNVEHVEILRTIRDKIYEASLNDQFYVIIDTQEFVGINNRMLLRTVESYGYKVDYNAKSERCYLSKVLGPGTLTISW